MPGSNCITGTFNFRKVTNLDVIKPSYEIYNPKTPEEGLGILRMIEQAARTCYKSEDKITEDSAEKFVKMLRDRKHHAMLEFGNMTVKIVTDRGITHELVRHRICSFAQESTRYCDYGGKGITVVMPGDIEVADGVKGQEGRRVWTLAMEQAQRNYNSLRDLGYTPQTARSVLPTCLKTEIVISCNVREWMHIFSMRTPITAHPDMRALMIQLWEEASSLIPIIFADLN